MSNNLSKHTLGLTQLQSGQGIPSHSAKLGSLYIDVLTSDYYKNTDGGTTWVLITSGTSATGDYLPLSGGTVTGNTIFTSGLTGNTIFTQTLTFDTTYTGTTGVGTMNWDSDFGTPEVGMIGGNVIQKVGESLYAYVRNDESTTLSKGEVVYLYGATGDKISVKRASNTGDTTSSKTLGVVAENITNGGLGFVITQGTLDGLNLGSYSAGTVVWLSSTPGQFTSTKQYAPYHLVFVGVVQRANNGNGQLYVKPQNGYELEELHDVMATGATYGDLIVYSADNGNNLWVSTKTLTGNYTINGDLTITGTTSSGTISATTYQNLPTDIRVTGATYSNNTFTYTNNTGGTFSVLFNTVTGLTTNGNLSVTGKITTGQLQVTGGSLVSGYVLTSDGSGNATWQASSGGVSFTGGTVTGATNFTNGLTANTISATTYQNLPTDIRVTGASYNNNMFTYTNNTGGTFNVLFNTMTGLTVNGNLTVTGNTSVKALTGTSAVISGSGQSILTVIGSGNSTTSPLFTVQGSSGELFSVTDSLTGSLFSVNDISGLPILEVFSDNRILQGSYLAPSLNTTVKTTLTAGTNSIYSIPTSAYTGAFFDYTVISTGSTGARAGRIMSIWSGTSAQYNDVSTNDIGTTTGITFSVAVSGSNAVLSSSATTTGWTLKTIVRSI